jgi:hypothetical protein
MRRVLSSTDRIDLAASARGPALEYRKMIPPEHHFVAPTSSLDDVVKAALEYAFSLAQDERHYPAVTKIQNAIRAAASDPVTIAAIIKTAGGKQ